jgi:hypothetical protein
MPDNAPASAAQIIAAGDARRRQGLSFRGRIVRLLHHRRFPPRGMPVAAGLGLSFTSPADALRVRGNCCAYLDGVAYPLLGSETIDRIVSPSQIEGIEVHTSPPTTAVDFSGTGQHVRRDREVDSGVTVRLPVARRQGRLRRRLVEHMMGT